MTQKRKILWLEQHKSYVEALVYMLKEGGFEVQTCTSIAEAIVHLEQHGPPDLLIYENALPIFGTEYTLAETDQGMRAGEVFVARYVRRHYPTLRVWMVTTALAHSATVRAAIRPEEYSWATSKFDLRPSYIVGAVKRILRVP